MPTDCTAYEKFLNFFSDKKKKHERFRCGLLPSTDLKILTSVKKKK